jgi:hypothetical protein
MQFPATCCVSSHLWDFVALHRQHLLRQILFQRSITDRRNRHISPLDASSRSHFHIGMTRRHGVSNPRIPASWWLSQLFLPRSAVLGMKKQKADKWF